jgi:V8-like Glu-specific endopeptidase
LSLDLRWLACRVHHSGGPLWISQAKAVGGMSGSPIIDKDGRAIGLVCTGSESESEKDYDGPHTQLMRSLPRWMTPLR